MKPKTMEEKILITSKRNYSSCRGWVGSGIVEGAKVKQDVIGFRIKRNGKIDYWLDLTIQEALDISWTLSKAVGDYFLKGGKYLKNPI